ncbi:uncharacterized protein LOC113868583 [Abrus precatorius]|uniref:Uncharacterized protein LOC113868583 n=1 Tax=Abrus precatorius TaxID=3816 RepID=A0A8B8LUM6_ABRPR|nr:uncharacterized protein LOC113868583 [Abrus precatorius]
MEVVMHFVVMHWHWYLWCCILLGYFHISCTPLSSGDHLNRSTILEDWLGYSGSFVRDDSQLHDSALVEASTSSFSLNESVSCEDFEGVGSFNTTCLLSSTHYLKSDIYIYGVGNLEILSDVSLSCPVEGCMITVNVSGNIKLGQNASIVAGSVVLSAANLTMEYNSSINSTSLGGSPPSQTSGTPVGDDGAGGGHGGRGASCLKNNKTNWGGDVYAWSTLSEPWSYGSKGGGKSTEKQHGGNGGGRVKLLVKDTLYVNGSVNAEGGDGGSDGGGGSGGSILVHAKKLKGYGTISAAGGMGWGGGGGGRISLDCYSIQEDLNITVHGGFSIGCPGNSGAAGTYFNANLLSLKVSNDNVTTETETPLLDFSTSPLWSNVYVENNAKVLVPLVWSRVQVRGQISVYSGGSLVFGLSDYPISEFELVAEELLLSDSIIKVFGAFRVSVKMLLMWNSIMQIDGGESTVVTASVLEVRNLAVLRQNSVIISNTNLALYGQGLLQLTGDGDAIKGQRLSLSLFYNVTVGSGSLLQAPLDDDASRGTVTKQLCDTQRCPIDLITPPDDCHVNYTLSFSLQICRVEDLLVNGIMKGSILHIHRARTVIVNADGMITASELGCTEGIGKGNFLNGAGGGAGHGGKGGSGYFKGRESIGGNEYGNAVLPCELGSGSEGPNESYGHVVGGGMIVIGSIQWPLLRLDVYGSLRADGESFSKSIISSDGSLVGGLGGGSGGTVLLFLQELRLLENSCLSVVGGNGGPVGGGGGGGGRIHFHWSKIGMGEEYVPVAGISGTMNNSGGAGNNDGHQGQEGTITGKACPKGLFGIFCEECPVGTYKDIDGSDAHLCIPCPLDLLPNRANFIYKRGGVTERSCPYKCISDKYRMPNCFTPLEELINTFGGPWLFSVMLSFILLLLALLLSTLRIKLIGSGSYHNSSSIERHNRHRFPYLLSLSEVRGARAEETQSHVHRMYFMGPNTFREPWHLPYSPPHAIIEIVYEDAFNRFIDEINSVSAYDWWEGSVHSILSVVAYPCAWSWKHWRRRVKISRLQEYVKSEYDHSCLRSCRSRALYKGMKVGATPDLMVAYIDFFLGGDEKRLDIVSIIQKRFPMCIIFGGDGSYMAPYNLHSDTLLTNLLGQHVPATVWNRLVAGLNAQLRTVRHGSIRKALVPVVDWINSHANPQLEFHGVKIELGWFQATASGYYQLGIVVAVGDYSLLDLHQGVLFFYNDDRKNVAHGRKNLKQLQHSWPYTSNSLSLKRITGGINGGLINDATLRSLDFKRDFLFPLSLLLCNTRPVGRQDTVQLLITLMLLADLSVTLLMLLQFYWISLAAFLSVLLILPLSLLSPFPAGLNALFSKEPRRASLSRVYALWNATSLSNIAVAFICCLLHYALSYFHHPDEASARNIKREDDKCWLLPVILFLFKALQARFVNWHIANIEIQDFSLFCPDPDAFWAHESGL